MWRGEATAERGAKAEWGAKDRTNEGTTAKIKVAVKRMMTDDTDEVVTTTGLGMRGCQPWSEQKQCSFGVAWVAAGWSGLGIPTFKFVLLSDFADLERRIKNTSLAGAGRDTTNHTASTSTCTCNCGFFTGFHVSDVHNEIPTSVQVYLCGS